MKRRLYITCLWLLSVSLWGQTSTSGCYLSGALIDPSSTAGCGNNGTNNYCNLASLYVPAFSPVACGTSTSSGGVSNAKATSFILPSGCTATVQAEYMKRNYLGVGATSTGCGNSGMDGAGDSFSITASGGIITSESSTINVNVGTCGTYTALGTYTTSTAALTTGCNNADGSLMMIVTGGTVTIAGNSNRADEIITYTLNMSGTCGPSCSSVLPIELLSFFAQTGDDVINLGWKVASEQNVLYYILEKSTNAIDFFELARISPKEKPGKQKEYSFTDDFARKGINYYRLYNIDKDGAKGNATLIAIEYEDDLKQLWFNQDAEHLYIYFSASMRKERLQLVDMTGKILNEISLSSGENKAVIEKNNFKGICILRSINGIRPLNLKVVME